MTRDDVIVRLRACRPIAAKLAREQGVETQLEERERATILALRTIADEGWFVQEWQVDDLRRAAGLLPSDLGLLRGWLIAEDWRRDPKGVLLELTALLRGHGPGA